jgi:glycosyltransferase involved in cell wall biosynthesis
MSAPIRSLHVDIEGGRGGSSRSLYQLLSRLDRNRIEPVVAYREKGPIEDWYRNLGIKTIHIPEICSYVPRARNSAKIFAASLPRLVKVWRATEKLLSIVESQQVEIIHLNYEGLFLIGQQLRKRTELPILCHVRAHLPENRWGRWLVKKLSRAADQYFFISPQEEARVRFLESTDHLPGEVVWNISPPPPTDRRPFSFEREVVYLGNIDRSKGVDRLIDVAAALKSKGVSGLRIAVYGEPRRARPSYLAEMNDCVQSEDLSDWIEFKGFTAEPEKVLSQAFALIRPSRERDPWGRDVIEATSFGVPVLATGSFTGVIDPGVTGYLFEPFDAAAMADRLELLFGNPELWTEVSEAAAARGQRMFSGARQVAQITDAIERFAGAGN